MPDQPLTGLRILITRPAGQSAALAQSLARVGGEPVVVPLLEIQPVTVNPAMQSALSHCGQADKVIFISPNAVQYADAVAPLSGLNMRCVLAPGAGTAKALGAAGVDGVIVPQSGNDSEALLALVELQNVRAEQISIVRGQGGREQLRDKLVERGADVQYVEVYRRAKSPAAVAALNKALTKGVDIVLVSSAEALQHLVDTTKGRLFSHQLFVPSRRVAELAKTLGFDSVHITRSPDDAGVVDSLLEWADDNAH